MPITADNFVVNSATAADLAALNNALHYIQTSMPINGTPVLQALVLRGTTIDISHDATNHYLAGSNKISWDPSSGVAIIDYDGKPIGINSPALTFLHEAAHATDPDLATNRVDKNALWTTDAERYASQVALSAGAEAGESPRLKYGGPTIKLTDVTAHTIERPDGKVVWASVDKNGTVKIEEDFVVHRPGAAAGGAAAGAVPLPVTSPDSPADAPPSPPTAAELDPDLGSDGTAPQAWLDAFIAQSPEVALPQPDPVTPEPPSFLPGLDPGGTIDLGPSGTPGPADTTALGYMHDQVHFFRSDIDQFNMGPSEWGAFMDLQNMLMEAMIIGGPAGYYDPITGIFFPL